MVEHRSEEPSVGGSIPPVPTNILLAKQRKQRNFQERLSVVLAFVRREQLSTRNSLAELKMNTHSKDL